MSDYDIKEWNEDNFDVEMYAYTSEAYRCHKYAFVSDVARFWIVYHYGGIYFDTDVELVQPIDDIVDRGSFMGCEKNGREEARGRLITDVACVNPGLGFGATPHSRLIGLILESYKNVHFMDKDGAMNLQTIVAYTTEVCRAQGLSASVTEPTTLEDVTLYPRDYFNPWDVQSKKWLMTSNTRSIHHYMASWSDDTWMAGRWKDIKYKVLFKILPVKVINKILLRNERKRKEYFDRNFLSKGRS